MTTFFEHQKLKYKKSYLRNLISLASTDGHLDDSERSILFVIGKNRGLKDWQVEELINDNSPFEMFIPESFNNRMNLLYDLMQLIHIDNHISENELLFVRKTLKAFNLSTDIFPELVELFKAGTPSSAQWREFTEAVQLSNNLINA